MYLLDEHTFANNCTLLHFYMTADHLETPAMLQEDIKPHKMASWLRTRLLHTSACVYFHTIHICTIIVRSSVFHSVCTIMQLYNVRKSMKLLHACNCAYSTKCSRFSILTGLLENPGILFFNIQVPGFPGILITFLEISWNFYKTPGIFYRNILASSIK